MIADSPIIRRKYLKGWFIVDLLSCIPDELFTLLFVNQAEIARHTEPHVAQLLGALKVLRLLRLGRVVRKVDMYLEFGGAVLLLLVVVFMLFAHWMACIWYSIGVYDVSRNITYGIASNFYTNFITFSSPYAIILQYSKAMSSLNVL